MAAPKFERSRDALVKDFTDVLAEAETLLEQAARESGEKASDLRSQVEAKLRSAKMGLQYLQHDTIDRARAATRVTDDYVRDNPWQAIGIAAAVGLVVGLLVRGVRLMAGDPLLPPEPPPEPPPAKKRPRRRP